jgi:tripartite-type tricarboxylate transporter receptor subunit TctC
MIDNKAGASGSIGADAVAKSAPDGYTLLLTATHLAIYPALNKKLPYDARKDFTPLSLVAATGVSIAVRADSPYKNLAQLIEAARQNPGKLSFGSTGTGGSTHLTGELLNIREGIKMVHVPYKGSGPALNDLLGGHLPVHIDANTSLIEQHKAGKLRILAVTTPKRESSLPDVPTVAEASSLKDFSSIGWFGIFGPAKMPPALVNTISTAIMAELSSAELRQKIAGLGAEPGEMTQPQFASFYLDELEKWDKVVKTANVTVD